MTAQFVVCLLARTIQTECHSGKRLASFEQRAVDPPKRAAIRDEAEGTVRLDTAVEDADELTMQSRFAPGEAHVSHTTRWRVAQDAFDEVERQLAGPGVTLLKAVPAAQVTPVGQFHHDATHDSSSDARARM